MAPLVGLIPAAGRGVRFGATGYAKELFPLLLANEADDEPLAPKPVCELALRGIEEAGATQCVVVVSPEKTEILRVLARGIDGALSLGYVVQPEPEGLPHAISLARPWLGDADVVFAMPDTVVLPADALAQVNDLRRARGADLCLGVFPVDEPERLGPVDMDDTGEVRRIYDKPGATELGNSWGVASWSSRFTEFCCEWEAQRRDGNEGALGHVFEAAREAGLSVCAHHFADGKMLDIGTPRGLRAAIRALTDHGLLDKP